MIVDSLQIESSKILSHSVAKGPYIWVCPSEFYELHKKLGNLKLKNSGAETDLHLIINSANWKNVWLAWNAFLRSNLFIEGKLFWSWPVYNATCCLGFMLYTRLIKQASRTRLHGQYSHIQKLQFGNRYILLIIFVFERA